MRVDRRGQGIAREPRLESEGRLMSLSEWIMVVEGDVDPSVVMDWNRWYDEVHLPEITSCPGFKRGSRFIADDGTEPRFLTIYELEDASAFTSPEFQASRGLGPFGSHVRVQTRLYRKHLALEGSATRGDET